MSDINFFDVPQRTFFITVWAKSLQNMGLGHLLNEDGKPKDIIGKDILDAVCNRFIDSGKERYCSGTACVSANDGFHLHLGAYCPSKVKPRVVAKLLGNSHIEPQRGKKEELLDYIFKRGEKWKDKGEDILCQSENMDGIVGHQGSRSELGQIEDLLLEGYTPSEIVAEKFAYRRYEKMIKDAYFQKRAAETPFMRDVYVEWHCGESGSGKTYFIQNLIETYGEEEVYFVTDYESGGMDKYNGQKILFLDEFRGQIRFSTLLSMLDRYKAQVHSRFTNIVGLWSKVYITSPLPPEQVYNKLVSVEDRKNDSMKQLFRRINTIVYHWKDGEEYKEFRQDMKEYTRYEDLKRLAGNYEFVTISKEEQMKIQDLFPDERK